MNLLTQKTYAGLGPAYAPPQPWKESDAHSKHPELAQSVFYYGQIAALKRHASEKGATWGWSELIPDGTHPTAAVDLILAILFGLTLDIINICL